MFFVSQSCNKKQTKGNRKWERMLLTNISERKNQNWLPFQKLLLPAATQQLSIERNAQNTRIYFTFKRKQRTFQ